MISYIIVVTKILFGDTYYYEPYISCQQVDVYPRDLWWLSNAIKL